MLVLFKIAFVKRKTSLRLAQVFINSEDVKRWCRAVEPFISASLEYDLAHKNYIKWTKDINRVHWVDMTMKISIQLAFFRASMLATLSTADSSISFPRVIF